ncbi:zinc finger protein neuro-d4-like [Diorhabda sublineata]|uniref:zinc finger protein neuro-d4-like n=1 Tax=Diorhabda sublineata TaxID=1163346 RepID=UPI0024E1170D|nr:zinc finger protein neuro-d4-like [Diorhabda sublineata]
MVRTYPDKTWLCPDCKTCEICIQTSKAGQLIMCSRCGDAYHPNCYESTIPEKNVRNENWECFNCLKSVEVKGPLNSEALQF